MKAAAVKALHKLTVGGDGVGAEYLVGFGAVVKRVAGGALAWVFDQLPGFFVNDVVCHDVTA